MRYHLRLTKDNRESLERDIASISSKGCSTILVAYEDWSIDRLTEIALHAHVLIDLKEHPDTLRARVRGMGYSTGNDYVLMKWGSQETDYNYFCKGRGRGDYDVACDDRGLVEDRNQAFWDIRAHAERAKSRKEARTPIYFQIADHIKENIGMYSRWVTHDGERELFDDEKYLVLDNEACIKYIVQQYSKNGPLFDSDTVKKVLYICSSRIDEETLANKIYNEFKQWTIKV